jgi:hypothetical protein
MENSSKEDAYNLSLEIADLRNYCKKNKLDLYFYTGIWDIKIGNGTLNNYIYQIKNKDIVKVVIQAVTGGPFFLDNNYEELHMVISPVVITGTFGEKILKICFNDSQKEILSFANEKILSEEKYILTSSISSTEISNFKGIINLEKLLIKFKDVQVLFDYIQKQRENIIILDSAGKSAKKHDFRSFLPDVYYGITGLEETELPLVLNNENESKRIELFYEKYRLEISKETSVTLSIYAEDRTFEIPGRGEEIFEWHIKIGRHTRIHYWIDRESEKVYIGHCGKHLPTAEKF